MKKYIQYYVKNIQPLRFADDNTSRTGQCDTVSYIPGTSIRGAIINGIAKNSGQYFENIKQKLFSDKVKFLNCYPVFDEKIFIPSPKGFYQKRDQKEDGQEVQNILVKGRVESEYDKKASMAPFAYWDKAGECIYHRDVKKKDDLNIWLAQDDKDQEKKIFRNTYIDREQTFLGLIAVEEEDARTDIEDAIVLELKKGKVQLGSRQTAGYGKCIIVDVNLTESSPYDAYAVKSPLKEECYMYLLSDMAMVNEYGENTGLNEKYLAKLLDNESVRVTYCAASAGTARGRNSTWKSMVPAVPVYQKGSVFKLEFEGELPIEKVKKLEYDGIGIKRNEGFGQVLFLDNYAGLRFHKKVEAEKVYMIHDATGCSEEDRESLYIIAKGYYINLLDRLMISYLIDNKGEYKKISNSQIGGLHALITSCKFHPEEVKDKLNQYYEHARVKEEENKKIGSKAGGKLKHEIMNEIFGKDINQLLGVNDCLKSKNLVMGIPVQELLTKGEEESFKIQLLTMIFEYIWREGKMDE